MIRFIFFLGALASFIFPTSAKIALSCPPPPRLPVSTASYTAMCVDWLWHLGLSVAVVVSAAYAVFFGCFGILLFVYHA